MTLRGLLYRIGPFLRVLPKCIADPRQFRYLYPWAKTYWSSPLKDSQPWITFSAREWLEHVLRKDMKVFEYGSGGSTLYFEARVERLISIEHHAGWYADVSAHLKQRSADHVEYLLRRPEQPESRSQAAVDDCYFSSRYEDANASFVQYARSIDSFPDGTFDIVFVDGRVRNACVAHALPKVKSGGWILMDNSERIDYAAAKDLLSTHMKIEFGGICPYGYIFWRTTAWKIVH